MEVMDGTLTIRELRAWPGTIRSMNGIEISGDFDEVSAARLDTVLDLH